MGAHQDARIAHEKKIARLQAELAPVESAVLNEQTAEANIDREIAKLAIKAARGDRAALKQQRELRVRKDEHHLQAENLGRAVSVERWPGLGEITLREAIAKAEAELPRFVLAEIYERVADGIRELPAMCVELSKVIEPIAKKFGEFGSRFNSTTEPALALVARGNPDRIRALENRLRTVLVRAIRCQLCFEFRSVGLDLIEVGQFEGKNFESVVRPVLEMLIDALEVDLHSNGVPTAGRRNFRCLTRIGGLFGLSLLPGEVISLPFENGQVKKMIEMGALEIVEAAPGNTEERA